MILKIPCCCLQFRDTEDPQAERVFTKEQAAVVWNFIYGLPDRITTLYCCCDWGQSRSAGLAAACMTYLGQDESSVFESPIYSPNLLVYSFMCEAMGCGLPSEERIKELRLRRSAHNTKINRVIISGDPWLEQDFMESNQQEKVPVWLAVLEERISKPVINRGVKKKTIPHTENELLNDRKILGLLDPGDLIIVLYGMYDLLVYSEDSAFSSAVYETASKMRKYILWLKYVYPGCHYLLMSPCCYYSVEKEMREQIQELTSCYCELAKDLNIFFLDVEKWGFLPCDNACVEEIQKEFAECMAEYLEEIS